MLLRDAASVSCREQPHRVFLQVREREQLRWGVVREVPTDRETSPAASWCGAFNGFHLHGGGRAGTWRVDDEIDPRIGGEACAVNAELEQLVLHEELTGSANVLRRPTTTRVVLSHGPTTELARSSSLATPVFAGPPGQRQRDRLHRRRAMRPR